MFLQSLYDCKERRIPISLTKAVLKRTTNAIFSMKKYWLRGIVVEHVNYK